MSLNYHLFNFYRPQFIAAYFEEPDHSGHVGGPFSDEVDLLELTTYILYSLRCLATTPTWYRVINIVSWTPSVHVSVRCAHIGNQ